MFDVIYQILKNFTKTERRIFQVSLALFLISGLLLGILIFLAKTVAVPTSSSLYKEGIIGQPIAVNPILAGANDTDRDLIELLFAGLLDLTENYKHSEDGQTWNLTLKDGLKWSDGKPLTSDDAIFTLDSIQNSENRSPLFLTWQGVIVNRINEKELEFTLRTPYAFFLQNLKDLKIIPKHIFGVIPVENFRLSNYNLEPVGSGPYKFVSSEKQKDGFITAYHLAANEYSANEKPYLKNFDVKFYSGSSDLIKAFNRKLIDGFGGLSPKNIGDLKLSNEILEKSIPRYYAIFLNKNAKTSLNDKNVVSALNLATDKKNIINQVLGGRALIANQPILPIMDGYDRLSDPGNEFSIEKANDLLNKSGWAINEKTGIREKKIGKQNESLEYSVIVPQIPFLTETIDLLKEDWAKIGVKLNPVILNPTDVSSEVIKTRNYQMIIFGNILRKDPDIFSFWHSSEKFYPGLNLSLYDNKKVDALLESIRKNLDENSRKGQLSQLEKLISDDQPAIFLYSPAYLYVAPKDFGGFEEKTINMPSNRFQNVNQWYLKTTRIFK